MLLVKTCHGISYITGHWCFRAAVANRSRTWSQILLLLLQKNIFRSPTMTVSGFPQENTSALKLVWHWVDFPLSTTQTAAFLTNGFCANLTRLWIIIKFTRMSGFLKETNPSVNVWIAVWRLWKHLFFDSLAFIICYCYDVWTNSSVTGIIL